MPVIQFLRHARHVQIEDFPKGCDRSSKGGFHVRPGATRVVTTAELDHLQKRKDAPLIVVRKDDPPPKEAPVAEAPAPDGAGDDAGSPQGASDGADTAPPADGAPDSEEPLDGASGGGKSGKRGRRRG